MMILQILFALFIFALILSIIIVAGVTIWVGLRKEQDDINNDPRV